MLIKKIELKDITTHKHTVIEFQTGLNVLIGKNGTGKSTILKMIGYTLFNYLPENQKSYVREVKQNPPKFGIIKIWIVGKKGASFIIERSIGKASNTLKVSDALTGNELSQISNKSDFKSWIITQIGLKPGYNLSTLFETSIGVPQGTFIEPFLRTTEQRRKFFDPILKVDVYKKIFKKLKKVSNEFIAEINELKVKSGEINGELKEKDSYVNEKEQFVNEIKKFEQDITETREKLAEITDKFNQQKVVKEKLDKSEFKYAQHESNEKSLSAIVDALDVNVKEAESAENTCRQTRDDFRRYNFLRQEIKELMNKNELFIEIKEKKNKIEQQLAGIESAIKENEASIDEIGTLEVELPILTKEYQTSLSLDNGIEIQKEKISNILLAEAQLNKITNDRIELDKIIKDLQEDLESFPNLREEVNQIEYIRKNKSIIEQDVAILKTEITHLNNNFQNAQGGKCPLIDQQCLNIKDTPFKTIFGEKISNLQNELNIKRNELHKVNQQLISLEKSQVEFEKLKIKDIELNNCHKRQKELLGKEIQELEREVSQKSEEERKISVLVEKKQSLKDSVEKYHVISNKVRTELPKIKEKIDSLKIQKGHYVPELSLINDKLTNLKDINDKMVAVRREMEEKQDNHAKYQANEKIAQNLPTLKINREEKENTLLKIKESLKKEKEMREKLKFKFDLTTFKDLEIRKNSDSEQLVRIETELKGRKERLEIIEEKLKEFEKIEKKLAELTNEKEKLEYMEHFTEESIRNWFDEAGPKITLALLARINATASELYNELMDVDSTILKWEKDYEVKIKSSENEKMMYQLSGGEQMSVALAIRLSILKILTDVDFAFFDEPTTNLDPEKRINLAKTIQKIKGFKQLFVISHDDTFEENVENVIKLTKNDNENTQVNYLGKITQITDYT